MNPKCQTRPEFDTFSAKSADLTGLKMRRITRGASFDDLVGAGEQRRWNFETERLGRDQADNQIEFGRLFDGEVCRLCAAQNLVDEIGGAAMELQKVRSIRHQTACVDILPLRINRR